LQYCAETTTSELFVDTNGRNATFNDI